jgi:hypothetical protein
MRAILAFLYAPALLPLAYVAAAVVTVSDSTGQADFVFHTVLPLTYLAAIILGVPGYLVLRAWRETSLPAYMVCGLLVALATQYAFLGGIVATWHVWWLSMLGETALSSVHTMLDQASWWAYGAACGGLVWLIARPDRRKPTQDTTRIIYEGMHRTIR